MQVIKQIENFLIKRGGLKTVQLKWFLWLNKLPFWIALFQAISVTIARWFAYLLFINIFDLAIPDSDLLQALFFNGSLSFKTLVILNLIWCVVVSLLFALNIAVCYLLGEFVAFRVRLHLLNSFVNPKKNNPATRLEKFNPDTEDSEAKLKAASSSEPDDETSRLLYAITSSTEAIRDYYCNFHRLFLFNILRLLFGLITIFLCSWQIGFYMLALLMFTYIGLPFDILFVKHRVAKFQEDTYSWFKKVTDLCGGYLLVFVHNMGFDELVSLENEANRIIGQVFPIAALQFSEKFFVVSVLTLGLPILLVLSKLKVFDTNVSVIFIIVRITEDLHNGWDEIAQCLAPRGRYNNSLKRIRMITNEQFKVDQNFNVDASEDSSQELSILEEEQKEYGEIRLDQVKLGYPVGPDLNRVIVQGSLIIPEGSVIGLVGESGSGKSTLLKSLYGVLSPLEGTITCGGLPIYEKLDNWLDQISVIPQDCYLFNRSIRENICYGLKRFVSDEEVEKAARLSAADEFIQKQPNGYNTMVQSGGMNLSGGQRQRIHLARAFLRNAKWIIMDEPTSALDTRIQQSLIDNLKGFLKDGHIAACIIATHRQEVLELCDQVYAIEEGMITKMNNE
jgi:ABC-type multidrug transport system fused ATPase/permease subunit